MKRSDAFTRRRILVTGAVALVLVAGALRPATASNALDWTALGREAVGVLSRYIQIDTTNPPGHELAAARFLESILIREGIEARVVETTPGRGNVYARLRGDGSRRAVLLLNHLDVVPADRRYWSVDPFGGVVKDGYVWGRGALDMKGTGVAQLMAMVTLKRQGVPLKSDVIFLGTADEEAGGRRGARAILRDHFDLVKDAGVVLNEGGNISPRGSIRMFSVGISEKTPVRLTLTATGTPGHGSVPRGNSAPNRLVAALERVLAYRAPVKVLPEVQSYYAALAGSMSSPWGAKLRDLAGSFRDDPGFAADFAARDPVGYARVRNTISLTMLEGSNKVNVIPAQATAQLDVRLLPGEDVNAFVQEIQRVVADPAVRVESTRPLEGGSSPIDHPLFDVLRAVARETSPDAIVTPSLLTGASDCKYFRLRSIPCYGFVPFTLTLADFDGFHGNNERLSVDNVVNGSRTLYDIVRRLAAD
jgi:acetylornithine deacetylase/succinyl-diaminopimelate desuccinylase-like protein